MRAGRATASGHRRSGNRPWCDWRGPRSSGPIQPGKGPKHYRIPRRPRPPRRRRGRLEFGLGRNRRIVVGFDWRSRQSSLVVIAAMRRSHHPGRSAGRGWRGGRGRRGCGRRSWVVADKVDLLLDVVGLNGLILFAEVFGFFLQQLEERGLPCPAGGGINGDLAYGAGVVGI